MPFIEVKAAGANIPAGLYACQLSDIRGPKTVTAQRGPRAGEEVDLLDWIWHIAQPGHPLDGQEISGSTSTASGPRSKLYAWLTALHNGVAPAVGTQFEKEQLIGRLAYLTIQLDEEGWSRIVNVGAMPVAAQQQQFQAATAPTPLQPKQIIPTQQQAAGTASPATDDLPF
jgi:hypothetical protein